MKVKLNIWICVLNTLDIMKKILLLLLPFLLVGCKEEQEENCIDKGYVYIDAVNCIHTKRACEGFGKTMNPKGGEIKIPYLEYIKIDSLENHNKNAWGKRESYLYGKKYSEIHVCNICVTENQYLMLKEKCSDLR